jgi:hypothetical protein
MSDMSRRKRARYMVVAASLVGLVLATYAVSQPPSGGVLLVTPMTTTVTIDSSVGETFSPPPPSAAPKLTPDQAWAQYANLNGSSVRSVPANVTLRMGLLTFPVGQPGVYHANNELAFGYSWSSCPPATSDVPLPPNPCIEWLFLDANTAQALDETWQQ